MEVIKTGFTLWNDECKKRENDDVLPVAGWRDMVFSCGTYLFLLQGVGELNNLCIIKRSGKEKVKDDVIEAVRSVLYYLVDNGIGCVTILVGSHHKSYEVLFRYFAPDDIIKESRIYFVNLSYLKDTL